jgi:hypothetical protein
MLSKKTKSRLQKGWIPYQESESNKSQSWYRLRLQIDDALSDLVLIGNKAPSEKLQDVFTTEKIKDLTNALLQLRSSEKIEPWKARLAATMAQISLIYCMEHYRMIMKNETLSEPLITELMTAHIRCAAIAAHLENTEIQNSKK